MTRNKQDGCSGGRDACHIFVLSLQDALDRRSSLLEQLQFLGLDYEVFEAIDGREGLPAKFESEINRKSGLTDCEFACALSHQSMYSEILRRDLPGAIILEDDAVVGAPFAAVARTWQFDFSDLILLYHELAFTKRRPLELRLATGAIQLFPLSVPSCGTTTGYAVTRKGALFLSQAKPIAHTADWPLDLREINALAAHPRIVSIPSSGQSHIEQERRCRKNANVPDPNAPYPRTLRRFRTRAYWRRKLIKIRSKRLS